MTLVTLPQIYADLTSSERRDVRLEYCKEQNMLCHYCQASLFKEPSPAALKKGVHKESFPPGFFNNKIHLHHSHKDGLTIGAVHAHCNAALWQHHGE